MRVIRRERDNNSARAIQRDRVRAKVWTLVGLRRKVEKLKSRERALRPEGVEVEREKKKKSCTVVQLIELKSSSRLDYWKKKKSFYFVF